MSEVLVLSWCFWCAVECVMFFDGGIVMNGTEATKKQNEYRSSLNCPRCGSPRTHYKQRIKGMVCEKCGNVWDKR